MIFILTFINSLRNTLHLSFISLYHYDSYKNSTYKIKIQYKQMLCIHISQFSNTQNQYLVHQNQYFAHQNQYSVYQNQQCHLQDQCQHYYQPCCFSVHTCDLSCVQHRPKSALIRCSQAPQGRHPQTFGCTLSVTVPPSPASAQPRVISAAHACGAGTGRDAAHVYGKLLAFLVRGQWMMSRGSARSRMKAPNRLSLGIGARVLLVLRRFLLALRSVEK